MERVGVGVVGVLMACCSFGRRKKILLSLKITGKLVDLK